MDNASQIRSMFDKYILQTLNRGKMVKLDGKGNAVEVDLDAPFLAVVERRLKNGGQLDMPSGSPMGSYIPEDADPGLPPLLEDEDDAESDQ